MINAIMRGLLLRREFLIAFSILFGSISVKSQTVPVELPECFGVNSNIHRSELRPMKNGAAYNFRTPPEGLSLLSGNLSTSKGCNYAFTLPDHSQYHSLTVFMKIFRLNTTEAEGYLSLLLHNGSKLLAQISLHPSSKVLSYFYLDTFAWPRNSTLIYMLVRHNFSNGTAIMHLDITITPTYLCFLNQDKSIGSNIKLRNPDEETLWGLSELLRPGWLICTKPANTQALGPTVSHQYFAYCIDYRLSCDGFINCPRDLNASVKGINLYTSWIVADESALDLICYSPPTNWFLVIFVILSVCNVIFFSTLSYIIVLRRFAPMEYLQLRNGCCRFFACCLPGPIRHRVIATSQFPLRKFVDMSDFKVPTSPPTYASVTQADHQNQNSVSNKKDQRPVAPRSGNAIPPSYADAVDEIAVIPDMIIQKMHELKSPESSNPRRTKRSKPPIMKPSSRNQRRSRNLRCDGTRLRTFMRHMRCRRHNRLSNTQQNANQFSMNCNHEQVPSQVPEQISTPLPNYSEFLSGAYPRYPKIVVVDYIRPPPDRVRRIYYGRRRRHLRRF